MSRIKILGIVILGLSLREAQMNEVNEKATRSAVAQGRLRQSRN